MSLREGLASWFKAVHHRHEHGIGGYCETCAGLVPADKSANDRVWFVMADECIRQMEWARHKHGWSTCPICGGPPHDDLTLAPEDWKP